LLAVFVLLFIYFHIRKRWSGRGEDKLVVDYTGREMDSRLVVDDRHIVVG